MIINVTNQEKISEQEIICQSTLSQARGLMFRKKHNLLMIFPEEKKVSLHMFFVFYPIQVIFLNKNKQVVEIKNDFKPFTFYTAKNKAKYVLEISQKNKKIKVGDYFKLPTDRR